jgi:hypothetical protein
MVTIFNGGMSNIRDETGAAQPPRSPVRSTAPSLVEPRIGAALIPQPFVVGTAVAPVSPIAVTHLNPARLTSSKRRDPPDHGPIVAGLGLAGPTCAARLVSVINLVGTFLRLAHPPAELSMPRRQRQHPRHRIPSSLGQESRIEHSGKSSRRGLDVASRAEHVRC